MKRDLIIDSRPFLACNAARFGLDRRALTRLVRAGVLRRPLRGVYVDARVPDTRDLRIACLQLLIPQHAAVWGRTAAWVWGVDSFAPGERDLLTPECVVAHHRARMKHPQVRVVEGMIGRADLAVVEGLRLTTPVRTALDLGRRLTRPMALAALDAFTHAELVSVPELRDALSPLKGYRGIVQARDLVALTEPDTESPGESWLRLRIVDAGFPRPRPQVLVFDSQGRLVYRIDLGYQDLRLGLEYDGREYHAAPEQRAHDDARRADLKHRFDWTVYGFGLGEVLGRQPGLELAIGGWLGREPLLPRRW